jgi:adenylate kinase
LLDGFPRTPAQAEGMKTSADLFIVLKVPDSELIERVVGRRLDPTTGKIYHIKYFPPPEDIQERLEQRSDDTKEKMTNRLRQFHNNVHAVRSYYENILTEIDGTGSPDDITQRIIQAINSKRRRVEM